MALPTRCIRSQPCTYMCAQKLQCLATQYSGNW
jgi:hypothetical protein